MSARLITVTIATAWLLMFTYPQPATGYGNKRANGDEGRQDLRSIDDIQRTVKDVTKDVTSLLHHDTSGRH